MQEVKDMFEKPQITLNNYDIHRQFFAGLPSLENNKLKTKLSSIGGWFSAKMKCKYFMLLCREQYDFTVFYIKDMNYAQAVEELKITLESRGEVVDILYVHGEDAYECWVKNAQGEVAMYYLFPYDWGVVEVS